MNYVNKTCDFIKGYTPVMLQIIKKLDGEKANYFTSLDLLFLNRFYYNSMVIEILLQNYKTESRYNFPIFLLLRTSLLDCIYSEYFIKIYKDSKKTREEKVSEIKTIMDDHINYLKRDMKFANERKVLGDNAYKRILKLKASADKVKSSRQMTREIETQYGFAYDAYLTLSKLEHIGVFSKGILEAGSDHIVYGLEFINKCLVIIFYCIEHVSFKYLTREEKQIFLDSYTEFCPFNVDP